MRIAIKDHERGIIFKDGNFRGILKPGKHFIMPFSETKIEILDITVPFYIAGYPLDIFLQDSDLCSELTIIDALKVVMDIKIKDILNTVLIAEKRALANVITRREETASTRSLLNTAKLMDENQTLFRLKELEFLEKICDKVGNISLTGSSGLFEQLNSLLTANK